MQSTVWFRSTLNIIKSLHANYIANQIRGEHLRLKYTIRFKYMPPKNKLGGRLLGVLSKILHSS